MIAQRQKVLLYAFLLCILLVALSPMFIGYIAPYEQVLFLLPQLVIVALIARLSVRLYGKVGAILIILFSMIPIVSFLALLIANAKANKMIKSSGFSVGFMGANLKEIAAITHRLS